MNITQVSTPSKPKKQGKPKFTQQYIPSSSCCGRCLFNIPPGTLLWLLPSVMLLVIGVVMVVLDKDGSWFEGLLQAGIILVIVGGGMSIATTVYCMIQMKRFKPANSKQLKRPPKQTPSTLTADSADGVQLVGIYRIRGQDNMAYAASQENVAYSPALETVPEDVVVVSKSASVRL